MATNMVFELFGLKEKDAADIRKKVDACFADGVEKNLVFADVLKNMNLAGSGHAAYCAYQCGIVLASFDIENSLAKRGVILANLLALQVPEQVPTQVPEDVTKEEVKG